MTTWHRIDGPNPPPKDGTLIDLWFAGDWNCRMPDASWLGGGFQAWHIKTRGCTYNDSPLITHWMHRPEPPRD